MGVSEELGGYVTITVAVIVVTECLETYLANLYAKYLELQNLYQRDLRLAHQLMLSEQQKAIEMGEVEGAMSSLAIAVAGILTVIFASVFANFY